jgi:hypothetical protein
MMAYSILHLESGKVIVYTGTLAKAATCGREQWHYNVQGHCNLLYQNYGLITIEGHCLLWDNCSENCC